MKHVLIFEKEEQALLHAGGMIQVDAKTWVQLEGAKRKVKIINDEQEQKLLPAPERRQEFFCRHCKRGFVNRRCLGLHNRFSHGIKSPKAAASHRRYVAWKAAQAQKARA